MKLVDMSVLETDAEKRAGPSPAKVTIYRDLAQLGEHLSYKQKFSSSTLLISTIYGAIGEVINTPDCDSGIHRFDSYIAPHEYKIVFKAIYISVVSPYSNMPL